MLVGLTGGIGSGKSTVAEIFHALNVPVINSDQITRQLMQPGTLVYKDIVDYFGKDIFSSSENFLKKGNKLNGLSYLRHNKIYLY